MRRIIGWVLFIVNLLVLLMIVLVVLHKLSGSFILFIFPVLIVNVIFLFRKNGSLSNRTHRK
jgi:hypothetical protein